MKMKFTFRNGSDWYITCDATLFHRLQAERCADTKEAIIAASLADGTIATTRRPY